MCGALVCQATRYLFLSVYKEEVPQYLIPDTQVQALLLAMCQTRQLKRINLGGNTLLSVQAEHIGQGLVGLQEISLESTYLTPFQVEVLSARCLDNLT